MRELARRAVACKHWEWLPGMLILGGTYLSGTRLDGGRGSLYINSWTYAEDFTQQKLSNDLPNFSDAATRGCLLQLCREARQDPNAGVFFQYKDPDPRHENRPTWEWRARDLLGWTGCAGFATEIDALVALLESCRG